MLYTPQQNIFYELNSEEASVKQQSTPDLHIYEKAGYCDASKPGNPMAKELEEEELTERTQSKLRTQNLDRMLLQE